MSEPFQRFFCLNTCPILNCFSDEDFLNALRNTNKKIDIAKELKVVDLTAGGKIQPYVKGLQVENELNKV